jgi:parvulin-like peptidyl-prolyl isomerase
MESVAFALEPGAFSDVFILAEAYHIIYLEERDGARELAPEILIDLKLSVFERWLDQRRAEAQIERLVGQ